MIIINDYHYIFLDETAFPGGACPAAMTRLLLIEDNAALSGLLSTHLTREGFDVEVAGNGGQAIDMAAGDRYDAMVLDLGLPDMGGVQVLESVNLGRTARVPCLVLTARDALESRIRLLESGADDYVLKPFEVTELVARLRAVLRRTQACGLELARGNVRYDRRCRTWLIGGASQDIPRRESMLLEELMRAFPRIVVKDRVEERLYDIDESVTPNAIEALVSRLRRRLAAGRASVQIHTVRGVGYRLVEADRT